MKKYLIPLLTGLLTTMAGHAASILDEPFDYPDGVLTNVAGGRWVLHSSSGLNVGPSVQGTKAFLSQDNTPDVNALLSGAPYSSGNLYASFVVNFTTLPILGGGYFAHFKDAGTGFRCRVFAAVTGAEAGKFRVGIARSGGAAVFISRDLDLNTDYLLVMRYDAGTGASTLWINPQSEASLTDRAEGTDTWAAAPIQSFALRQAPSMGVLTLDTLKVGTAFGDVVAGGDPSINPPGLSSIPDQSIPMNGATAAIPFTVTDGETPVGALTAAATASSNPTLLPLGNIVFTTDGGSNRTVMATPAVGQQGSSKVTVTVTDGNMNTATRDFLVIVGAPTISTFSSIDIATNTSSPAIPFTIGDLEGDILMVSATSSNETLLPISGIVFSGSGANRTVTLTPATDIAGLSRITIFVTDGFNTASNSFVVTVQPFLGLIVSDDFSYPDGPLTGSGNNWISHSGTFMQMQVVGGQIQLTGANSEDVSLPLGTGSYPPGGGWVLYSSFTVKFTARPNAAGDYFAHFKSDGNSFGARVFAIATGAANNSVRLGLANNAGSPSVVWPSDLQTGVTHTVVTRINVGTGRSTFWVNPTSEQSSSLTATDGAFPFTVYTYAFREAGAIGEMFVDRLRVGTSFSDVVETTAPAPSLTITAVGNNVTLSWPAAATDYVLRYTDGFPATWVDFIDQGSVQGADKVVNLNGVSGNRFFELRKP